MADEKKLILDDTLFVQISETKRFNEGPGMKRTGFARIAFEKQRYVTVTLTDHSAGHGVVKSVILRNPDPNYLARISDAAYWGIRKHAVELVLENSERVERTFRVVFLRTAAGDQVMSAPLEKQIKNLAANATIRHNDDDLEIIGFVKADGKIEVLKEDDDTE